MLKTSLVARWNMLHIWESFEQVIITSLNETFVLVLLSSSQINPDAWINFTFQFSKDKFDGIPMWKVAFRVGFQVITFWELQKVYYQSKRYCPVLVVQQGGGQFTSLHDEALQRDQNRTIPFGTIVPKWKRKGANGPSKNSSTVSVPK